MPEEQGSLARTRVAVPLWRTPGPRAVDHTHPKPRPETPALPAHRCPVHRARRPALGATGLPEAPGVQGNPAQSGVVTDQLSGPPFTRQPLPDTGPSQPPAGALAGRPESKVAPTSNALAREPWVAPGLGEPRATWTRCTLLQEAGPSPPGRGKDRVREEVIGTRDGRFPAPGEAA